VEDMDCSIKAYVKKMEVRQWLQNYCFPEKFKEFCKACPNYDNLWSCPPSTPAANGYLDNYEEVYTIAVKVIYNKELLLSADTREKAEKIQKETYWKIRRVLFETLLYIENKNPGTLVLSPGSCELCEKCSKIQDKPCVRPEKMRYSFGSFGFDCTKLSKELFDLDLLWNPTGLPEYNLAIAALLIKDTKNCK
jgi:predicted metal-binding protein